MKYYSQGNKIVCFISPKCGSRTITGLTALTFNPELIEQKPEFFTPQMKILMGTYYPLERALKNFGKVERRGNLEEYKYKIAIKRDPVERFESGYRNRILYHKELLYGEQPTFNEFLVNFDEICYKNAIKGRQVDRNFKPQVNDIGPDASFYDAVFETHEMDKVFDFYDDVYGIKFPRLKLQQSPGVDKIIPTEKEIELIKKRYKVDYESWFPEKL